MFIGLGGIAVAFGLDMMDHPTNSMDEAEERVGRPVLTSIQAYGNVRLVPRR